MRRRQFSQKHCVVLGFDPSPGVISSVDELARYVDQIIPWFERQNELVVKYNIAYFERFGARGLSVLEGLVSNSALSANRIIWICDAKRGDVGHTSECYREAVFEHLKAHAVTVSPYLGEDTLKTFFESDDRGVFVLAKTSNPGSADLQDLGLLSEHEPVYMPVYMNVMQSIERWRKKYIHKASIGAVVGATHPMVLNELVGRFPQSMILVPGLGAQGGDVDSVRGNARRLQESGGALLANVGRGIFMTNNRLASQDELSRNLETWQKLLSI